ncbi:MAG: thioredoxin domain-containing protein [Pyrinomonadaceae bacterium]
MKPLFLILILSVSVFGQKPDEVLATATGHIFRLGDLSAEAQKAAGELPARIPAARTSLLEQMVSRRVFDAEAKARGVSMGKLIADVRAKIKDPTESQITTVVNANSDQLSRLTSDKARQQVIAYLRNASEQKALGDLFDQLRIKYKVTAGKDVNRKLVATDVVAVVAGRPITAREFEMFVEVPLYEARADLADLIMSELDEKISSALTDTEAKSLGVTSSDLIAREVTNKMKAYTDAERFALEDAFRTKLLNKYQAKILYREPTAPRQDISIDDDPAIGSAAGPVTIVMFSDFQCSACAATHPVLTRAIAEYPGKIRLVVRDFPLETIHENAFNAALAANAAHAQGKFFEYTELLYARQDRLDIESLRKYAAEINLNAKQFELDLKSEKAASEVRKDIDDGEAYAVNSTPTIFVNGVRARNLSAAGLRAAIERAMRK